MLSITQPSLSHAISQLEQELGTRLFEKKGRNVVLTRYGKMFLPYVEESLKVLNEGVQRIQEVNGSRHGIIHLAYIYTMGSEFVPKLVRKFLDAYPDYDIEFHFTVGTTGEIIDGLKDDKYDIVFSSYKDGEQDIDFKKIANQKLVLAVPMDHPLSIKDSVDLRDTIEYPQIYFEKGSGLRPVIDQMFEEIGQFPKVSFEMEEDSSMAGLVAQGFGIAVMPDIPILRSLSVKTLDIYNPPYERAVYLATLKQRYLSPVAKAFIRFVIEETA
jgi:DNA-binding transcriptional LysR family regulator